MHVNAITDSAAGSSEGFGQDHRPNQDACHVAPGLSRLSSLKLRLIQLSHTACIKPFGGVPMQALTIPLDSDQRRIAPEQTIRSLDSERYHGQRWQLSSLDTGYSATISEHTAMGARRADVERYIRERYLEVHGAVLDGLMPELYSLRDANAELLAAVGLRRLSDGDSLFERYLDEPAEVLLEHRFGQAVARDDVFEVGNLAATSVLSGSRLVAFLYFLLASRGKRWALCTGTDGLRLTLRRARVPFHVLGNADPSRLGAERLRWGSYYEHSPQLLAIDVDEGMQTLASRYRFGEMN